MFLSLHVQEIQKSYGVENLEIMFFDFFLIWKVLIYFYHPEKIGLVAILL